ncbi:hypothetical protein BC628DRAFT_1364916 [Trametes gibbosa]|nr:hypothetical protein BC628DRAFT_1364916 [Trametes gibbosa]
MARATRSTATTTTTAAEKDKPIASPPTSRKGASKKRKRNSNAENGDSPPTKHARAHSKDEPELELEAPLEEKKDVELLGSGDVPIQSADAANILEVLEMVDTQGLLDRVFPLPAESGRAAPPQPSSSSPTTMLSFRSLLKNASQHPLSVLRAAVKHLHPISFHPRSCPSEPAAQQLHFCTLATSLLDEASRNNIQVPLHVESLLADGDTEDMEDTVALPSTSTSGLRPHKYALVQHLPTGDWWSSASSGAPTVDGDVKDLKSLHTAKAELVAIFPSASSSGTTSEHTLGDYVTKKPPGSAPYRAPPPDGFAPCFDQDGVEVGRIAMGEVIFDQEMKRRLRALAKGKRRAFASRCNASQAEDVDMEEASDENAAGPSEKPAELVKGIEGLLPAEEVEAIKASLGTLEMEQAVDELLQKNSRALQRLEELQLARLQEQRTGSSIVEISSEEWDIAQGIIDSLTLLASLRPRPSNGDSEQSPLVPPPSVLHKLQRTLPVDATAGWYGTLPEGHPTAFRDDTTVHLRTAAVAVVSSTKTPIAAPIIPTTPAAKTPAAAAAAAAVATPTTPYTPYTYANNYQSTQYRGGYGTYTPTAQSTGSYYPNYATQSAGGTQGTQASHYPNAQYAGAQGGYTYSPWYYQSQAGTASGRATPQPAAGTVAAAGGAYYAAAAASGQQATAQRAVANTVMSSAAKPYQAAAWPVPAAGAPTLPPHMRGAAGAGTPPPASGYAGYYGGYQAPR